MSGSIFRNYAIALTSPTAWIGIFLVLGIILLWCRKLNWAKWTLSLGVFLFALFAFDPFTEFLLNNFENKYKSFEVSDLKPDQKIEYVVVLAGGHVPFEHQHPLTTELTRHTLTRLAEGIKIHHEILGSKIIFTGKGWAKKTEAEAMKELALSLGVKAEDIIMEQESTNTYDHTKYLKSYLKDNSFILVTSAMHMPRAMGLFEKAGYKPIPAPTAHLLLGKYVPFRMKVPFPTGDNLEAIDYYFNELAGIVIGKMTGKI